MRQVVHKLFFIWDYEKEEAWLNEMAAKGLALISVRFLAYEFENTLPGEYHVCVQITEHSSRHPETAHYIHFLEETGVQHVGTIVRNSYFRKKTADGPLDLFSDNASLIKHMNYILAILYALMCPNLFNFFMSICNYMMNRRSLGTFFFLNALICLFPIGLLCVGIVKLSVRKKKLKQEQQIFE